MLFEIRNCLTKLFDATYGDENVDDVAAASRMRKQAVEDWDYVEDTVAKKKGRRFGQYV